MKIDIINLENTLENLKNTFNYVFTNPVSNLINIEKENFISIYIFQKQFALKISELKGIELGKKILSIPSEDKSLLGISVSQGQVIPIFSLAMILGIQKGSEKENAFIICGENEQAGFAFTKLGDSRQILKKNIMPIQDPESVITTFMVHFETMYLPALPILNVLTILDSIMRRK